MSHDHGLLIEYDQNTPMRYGVIWVNDLALARCLQRHGQSADHQVDLVGVLGQKLVRPAQDIAVEAA